MEMITKYVHKKMCSNLFVIFLLVIICAVNLVSCTNDKQQDDLAEKREFVKIMMRNAWNAYTQHAWGSYALNPIAKTKFNAKFPKESLAGQSIVASMSTLWIMELNDEFGKGMDWISKELNLSAIDHNFNVHDVILNYVGGLLSISALTHLHNFADKAIEIAELVQPAFYNKSGLPLKEINFFSKTRITDNDPTLSEVSGFQLEFNYLSDSSGETKFRNQISIIQKALRDIAKADNIYYEFIHSTKEENAWASGVSSFYERGRELYSSLVKSFIQSNLQDERSIQMYKEALDEIQNELKLFSTFPNGLHYAKLYDKYHDYKIPVELNMKYSACHLGAMLSLGSTAMKRALALNKEKIDFNTKHEELHRIHTHWKLAEQITETCNRASNETQTGLGPEKFLYDSENLFVIKPIYKDAPKSLNNLSPELAESNFILWRLTHSPKYRENAWKMVQAIERHARTESGGYSVVQDVTEVAPIQQQAKQDYQPPIFLSATLKYLYLTFTDDDVLPLEKWVFNSVGHPLPICGNNSAYSNC